MDGRVAIVTLDHPPVNALSSKLLEELEDEYDRLDRDDEVRAIVLRGEGEKAFVAGADITEFPAMREQIEEAAETGSARGIQKLAARMDAGRTPVIAAIHGYCLGGGLELAMACARTMPGWRCTGRPASASWRPATRSPCLATRSRRAAS